MNRSFREGIAAMRKAAENVGRDTDSLRVVLRLVESADIADSVAESLQSLAAIGVTDVIVDVDWASDDGPERSASALIKGV